MKIKLLISIIILALLAAVAILPSAQVNAACGVILTGSFPSGAPNQTSSTFAVIAGDIVTATATDSAGTATGIGAEITINGTVYGAGLTSTASHTYTAPPAAASGTGSVFFYNNGGTGVTINWTITISGPNCVTATAASSGVTWDDRVNPEPHATAVLYCRDGAIHVYDIDLESKGRILFVVTPEEVEELGVPESNTILESAQGTRGLIAIYRLASGEFQLVAPGLEAGTQYNVLWDGCVDD